MIITSDEPFSQEQLEQLKEELDPMIKTVFDFESKICSAGAFRHYQNEEILLKKGSKQGSLWGGGINTETSEITYDSMINARPRDGNKSNELLSDDRRQTFTELTKYFFDEIIHD